MHVKAQEMAQHTLDFCAMVIVFNGAFSGESRHPWPAVGPHCHHATDCASCTLDLHECLLIVLQLTVCLQEAKCSALKSFAVVAACHRRKFRKVIRRVQSCQVRQSSYGFLALLCRADDLDMVSSGGRGRRDRKQGSGARAKQQAKKQSRKKKNKFSRKPQPKNKAEA
jgi:hypothetical protein